MNLSNIGNIRSSLYRKARGYLWASMALWFTVVLFASFGLFIEGKCATLVALLSAIFPFAISYLRRESRSLSRNADKCRRLMAYCDGLGVTPDESTLLEVGCFLPSKEITQANFTPPYYDTSIAPGPERLKEIIKESSFFTKELAKKTVKILDFILWTIIIFVVSYVWLSDIWVSYMSILLTSIPVLIKSFLIFIMAWLAGDLFELRLAYRNLAEEAQRVFDACYKVNNNENSIVMLAGDYDACVQDCYPIPELIYKKNLDELNKTYKGRIST